MVTFPNQRQTILAGSILVLLATIPLGMPPTQHALSRWLDLLASPSAVVDQTLHPASLPSPARLSFSFPSGSADLHADPRNDAVITQAAAAIAGLKGMPSVELVWLADRSDPLRVRRAAKVQAALLDTVPIVTRDRFAPGVVERADLAPGMLLLTIRVRATPTAGCPDPIEIVDPSLPGAATAPDQAVPIPLPANVIARGSDDVLWRVAAGPWTALADARPPTRCGSDLFLSIHDHP